MREYLVTTQGTQYEQNQQREFLSFLSQSLQTRISIDIFEKQVQKNQDLYFMITNMAKDQAISIPDIQDALPKLTKYFLSQFVKRMVPKLCRPDEVIIQNLDQGDSMYLIAKGECKATISTDAEEHYDDNSDSEHEDEFKNSRLLRPGHYFGEISLIFGCERTAQVIATKYCTLAQLTRDKYREILHLMPDME